MLQLAIVRCRSHPLGCSSEAHQACTYRHAKTLIIKKELNSIIGRSLSASMVRVVTRILLPNRAMTTPSTFFQLGSAASIATTPTRAVESQEGVRARVRAKVRVAVVDVSGERESERCTMVLNSPKV